MKWIESGSFCSFGPSYDSRFANLSKEDSDALISSFHAEDDLTHVTEIRQAIGKALGPHHHQHRPDEAEASSSASSTSTINSSYDYELDAVDGLLDALSGGEYRKRPEVAESCRQFREMEKKINPKMRPNNVTTTMGK